MRQPSLHLLNALQRDPRILERFWSHVEKDSSKNSCWEWTGRCRPAGYPTFQVGQWTIAPAYLTWFSSTGEWPLGGRMHRLCENGMCIRPSHLAWIVGRVTESRILAQDEGYLSLAGVKHTLENPSPRLPRTVRLAPAV